MIKIEDIENENFLNLNNIFQITKNIFLSNLREHRNQLRFPAKKSDLFSFYDEYIEELFLEKFNYLNPKLVSLFIIMLWAFYQVWSRKTFNIQAFNDDEFSPESKNEVISLFLDNLDNKEGAELLECLNIDLNTLKKQNSNTPNTPESAFY